jgi:hypothetical protein
MPTREFDIPERGMRPLAAHCHRGLGTLYATTGQSEQAGAELSLEIALYKAVEMTFWLPQAEAALVRAEGGENTKGRAISRGENGNIER